MSLIELHDKAHFCPQCGSPAVDVSSLAGATATCRVCAWTGPNEQLATHSFVHNHLSKEQVTAAFTQDLKVIMAKDAGLVILRMLLKWGFMESPDPKVLTKYLVACATAMGSAILETRERLEVERHAARKKG
jgi:hypothetical protein